MKQQVNKHRSDRQFQVDDWVYVKLQPYRQSIIVNKRCFKLSTKFFGLYRVLEKVGSVAYKLTLLAESKIHPVFHVSQLKKHVGLVSSPSPLPVLNEDGVIAKEPVRMLDRRMVNKHGKAEVLVFWKNCFPEDSTWESFNALMQRYLDFHP